MKKKLLIPTTDDDDFEDLCRDLWREIWNDPEAKRYGRKGQKQFGIDIVGTPEAHTHRPAVQCKVREKDLSEEAVRRDCEAAKQIDPPIRELTFATTSKNSTKLIDLIAKIDAEHQRQGIFRVKIKFWDEIDELIRKNHNTYYKHYKDEIFQTLRIVLKKAKFTPDELANEHIELFAPYVKTITETLVATGRISIGEISSQDSNECSTSASGKLLDEIKDCLNTDKVSQAFTRLKEFEDTYLAESSETDRFRYYYYLGDSYNEINDQEKCAKYFREAYNTKPKHKIANKLKALSLLIQGDKAQAGEYAQKAIEIDPCDEIAYQVMVQVHPERSVEEILAPIPDDKKNETRVAFSISEVYKRKGELLQALEWLEKALISSNDSFKVKIHLAQALFEYAFKQCELSYYGRKNPEAESKIRRAIELIDSAYEYIKTDEKLYKSKAYLLVNKANAYRLLGEYDLSEKTFDEYFQIVTGDDETIRLRALLAMEIEKFSVAETLLKTISNKEMYVEVRLMLAEALKCQKKYDEALAFLDEEASESSELISQESHRLRINILLEKKDTDAASLYIDSILAKNRTIPLLVDKARILRARGQEQEALNVTIEAEKLVTETTSIKEKFDLGMHCYELKRYNKAALFLSQIDTQYSESFLTQRLVYSYYFSGQENKAIEICQQLRAQFGAIPFAADLEAQLYQYIGDYNRAIEIYNQMLVVNPDKFEIKLRITLMRFQQDDFAYVDKFLADEAITIDRSIPLDVGLNYTYLLKERGQIERVLNVLYELRRVHYNSPEAHLKYMGLFFEHDESIAKIEGNSGFEAVSLNTAVHLQSADGKDEWLIIEERTDADLRFRELHQEHILARELLGKKANESLSDRRVVKGITSKYTYAYQESMNQYNEYFPESDAMEKVQLPEAKEEDGTLDSFRPIFDRIDAQNEYRQKAQSFYEIGHATVGSLGVLMGTNPIKTWAGLLRNDKIQLAAMTGTEEERKAAFDCLKAENPTLVLDIIALLTIHELGIADKIKSVYKNLVVNWATIHTINEYLLEMRGSLRKGYLTIGKEGDTYVKYEVKPEHLQKQYEYLNSLYQWVKTNCDIQPIYELLDKNRFDRQEIRALLGESFYDSTLIATRENHFLYTDDARLRIFAEKEHGLKGVWTQALIFDLENKGQLNKDEYVDYILKLADLNYDYVSVNWQVMLESYRRSEWQCAGIFEKVTSIILSNRTTLDSSVRVLIDFYWELWRESIPIESKEEALRYTLFKLFKAIKSMDRNSVEAGFNKLTREKNHRIPLTVTKRAFVLQLIRHIIKVKFEKIEFTRVQILSFFDEWCKWQVKSETLAWPEEGKRAIVEVSHLKDTGACL